MYETFTKDQVRFGRPHNPEFLLKPGELLDWFGEWQRIHYFEGVRENPPRAVAQLVARKPADGLSIADGTISAGGGAGITLDANALTKSSAESEVLLDGNANMKSSAGSHVLLDANALMESTAGDKVLLDGKATVSSKAVAKLEAPTSILSGGDNGSSTTKADAGGVAVTGAKISLNG